MKYKLLQEKALPQTILRKMRLELLKDVSECHLVLVIARTSIPMLKSLQSEQTHSPSSTHSMKEKSSIQINPFLPSFLPRWRLKRDEWQWPCNGIVGTLLKWFLLQHVIWIYYCIFQIYNHLQWIPKLKWYDVLKYHRTAKATASAFHMMQFRDMQ